MKDYTKILNAFAIYQNGITTKNISTNTILTFAKRASLVYLMMPSFILSMALVFQGAVAQNVEFLLQFGTSEEDSTTVASAIFADSLGFVYVVGSTDGTLPDRE